MISNLKTIPNQLSFIRILLTPLILFFIINGGSYYIHALLFFTIAVITDFLDGYIARSYNIKTKIGEFLDPFADKILVLSTFFSFYIINILDLWVIILIVMRDVVVTLLRLRMLQTGHAMITSRSAQWKTGIQFFSIYILIIYLLFSSQTISLPNIFLNKFYLFFNHTNIICLINGVNCIKKIVTFKQIFMYCITAMTVWTGISYLVQNRKAFI